MFLEVFHAVFHLFFGIKSISKASCKALKCVIKTKKKSILINFSVNCKNVCEFKMYNVFMRIYFVVRSFWLLMRNCAQLHLMNSEWIYDSLPLPVYWLVRIWSYFSLSISTNESTFVCHSVCHYFYQNTSDKSQLFIIILHYIISNVIRIEYKSIVILVWFRLKMAMVVVVVNMMQKQ